VWLRLQKFQGAGSAKIRLSPRQEHLLGLLRDHGSLAPAEIWKHLKVSRQGAMNIITPLLDAGLIEKRGTRKSGRYYLIRP
jgi:DNA-binding MarR family transcriptional regulator